MIINPYVFATAAPSYAYWNPADKTGNAVLSDNDKVVSGPLTGKWVRSITSKTSGKWRIQFVNVAHVDTTGFGFSVGTANLGSFLGGSSNGYGLWGNYGSDLRMYNNGSPTTFSGITIATNDTIDLLIDIGAGLAWWQKNGTVISGNPVAGTGAMATFTGGSQILIAADPFASNASTRLRTNPSEMTGSSISGFTDGWPV